MLLILRAFVFRSLLYNSIFNEINFLTEIIGKIFLSNPVKNLQCLWYIYIYIYIHIIPFELLSHLLKLVQFRLIQIPLYNFFLWTGQHDVNSSETGIFPNLKHSRISITCSLTVNMSGDLGILLIDSVAVFSNSKLFIDCISTVLLLNHNIERATRYLISNIDLESYFSLGKMIWSKVWVLLFMTMSIIRKKISCSVWYE